MIIELREKTQITIPQDIVARLGLTEGDKLEITESNGVISIVPVAVYPEGYVAKLKKEIANVKGKIDSGEQPVFDSVDEMTEKLEAMANELLYCNQHFFKTAVRENRVPFELSADPFYSKENMEELERRVADIHSGKDTLKEHELIEVD